MNRKMLDLLARSLDGELTPEERSTLDAALAGSAELRRERDEIVALRNAVASSRRAAFRPFFQARVMERIRREQLCGRGVAGENFLGALARVFRPVAIAGAIAVAALLVFNLTRTDEISVAGALGISSASSQEIMESPVEAVLEVL